MGSGASEVCRWVGPRLLGVGDHQRQLVEETRHELRRDPDTGEHGIGRMKRTELLATEPPVAIDLMRRIKRDVNERGRSMDSVMAQYQKTVRPMFLQFIDPSKQYADIIVPRGGKNRIAIDILKAKISQFFE